MENHLYYQVYNQFPEFYRPKISSIEDGHLILLSGLPNKNRIVIVKKYGDKNKVPRNMRSFTFDGNGEGLKEAKEKCKNQLKKQLIKYTDKNKGKFFIREIARNIVNASEKNGREKDKLFKEICIAITSIANSIEIDNMIENIDVVDYKDILKLKSIRSDTLCTDDYLENMKDVFGVFYSIDKKGDNIFIRENMGTIEDANMVRKWGLKEKDFIGKPLSYEDAYNQLKKDYMNNTLEQASEIDDFARKSGGLFAGKDKKEYIARKRVDNYLKARELCEINHINEKDFDNEEDQEIKFLTYDVIKRLPVDIVDKIAGREYMLSFENEMEYVTPKIMLILNDNNYSLTYFYKLMNENKTVGYAKLDNETGKLELISCTARGKVQLYERIDDNVTAFRKNEVLTESKFEEVSSLDIVRNVV